MALFSKDPQRVLERDINAARSNLTRLRTQLAEAEAAIGVHREQAKTAAVTGADSHVLDAAENLIRNAQIRRETFSAAVIEVETQLAALELAKAEATDRAQREQTAQSCELLARRVTESAEAMTKAVSAFADYIAKAATITPEAAGLVNFTVIYGNEVPGAVAQTAALLRAHAASVLRSDAPPVPAQEPMQVVFCVQQHGVKWLDDAGQQKLGFQFNDVVLPTRLVDRALARGACILHGDPRRSTYHRPPRDPPPRAETCLDLDAPDAEPKRLSEPMASPRLAEPILASAPEFTRFDRGPGFTLPVATLRVV